MTSLEEDIDVDIAYDGAGWVLLGGVVIILVGSLGWSARSINKIGQRGQHTRSAVSAIYIRLGLSMGCVILSLVLSLVRDFDLSPIVSNGLSLLLIVSLLIAFIVRVRFAMYQGRVTSDKTQGETRKENGLIEDGFADEQELLIDPLKGEEVTLDQMVAEKNVTVGRAQELL